MKSVLFAVMLCLSGCAERVGTHMQTGVEASPPSGAVQYCIEHPKDDMCI